MYSQTSVTVSPRAMPQPAFDGAPARNHLVGRVEVDQEAERRDADAHQREDDREWATAAEAEAFAAANAEEAENGVAER